MCVRKKLLSEIFCKIRLFFFFISCFSYFLFFFLSRSLRELVRNVMALNKCVQSSGVS